MLLARPDALARVRREIETAGPLDAAGKVGALGYLAACITETGRLFPPVVLTAHRAARSHTFEGIEIEAGAEILQFFPFANRDTSVDPDANRFRPERWLDPSDPAHSRPLNTFLSGSRACPGRDLILLVVTSAIAGLVRDASLPYRTSQLSTDPLPFSFPNEGLTFLSGGIQPVSMHV
jgi:cytochrome P450